MISFFRYGCEEEKLALEIVVYDGVGFGGANGEFFGGWVKDGVEVVVGGSGVVGRGAEVSEGRCGGGGTRGEVTDSW